MAAESWVRLWAGMTTDPKWQTIARKSGQPRALVIALFTHLMLEANEADERGSVSHADVEDMASALDCDEEAIVAILEAMQGRVIVDGRLAGWDRRQPKREDSGNTKTGALSSTERSRLHRERQREKRESNADATQATATQRNATQCNAPEAEAEAEADKPLGSKQAASQFSEEPRAPAPETPAASEPDPIPPGGDATTNRPAQITVILRRNGACPRTHPGSRGIAGLVAMQATDVEILTALETAKQRRRNAGSAAAITPAYLLPIVQDQRQGPPARASPGRPAKFDPVEYINAQRTSRRQQQQGAPHADHPAPPADDPGIIDVDAVRLD